MRPALEETPLKIRDSIAVLVDTLRTAAATLFESRTKQRLTGISKLKPRVKQRHNQDNLSNAICVTYRQDGSLFRKGLGASSGRELRSEVVARKVASDSRSGFNSAIEINVLAGNMQFVLQRAHQLNQAALLGRRGLRKVEITDQADADAIAIDVICSGSKPRRKLLGPPLADLDFAISAAVAVANDEMIGQSGA